MKKAKPFFIVLCIVSMLSFAVFFTIYDFNNVKKLHQEFDKVEINDSLNGIINDIYTSKGASFITLKCEKKIFLKTSFNYQNENGYLDKSLKIGDSILKNAGSDTLFIIKPEKTEYFILGKFIKGNQN